MVLPTLRSTPAIAASRRRATLRALRRRPLPAPVVADPQPRHLLDPRSGWLRRSQRALSIFLSRHVYSRVPRLQRVYDAQLGLSLTISEAEIPLSRLSPCWDGTTLLLLADIHAGPFLSPPALVRAVERLSTLEADLILLAGDLVTSQVHEFLRAQSAFRELRAPLGVFGVLGNHDHYSGESERLTELLEETGIRILHNSSALLQRAGSTLAVAGIDDLLLGEPDLEAALSGTGNDHPVILLSHNPDIFFAARRRGVDLVLSGHTHGGQIRIPGLPVLVRMSRYRLDDGRYQHQRGQLVVTRGLGVVGLPYRIACAPEAVLLTLRSSPADTITHITP
jgi:predicted MPP superfamily phosphohydrolase